MKFIFSKGKEKIFFEIGLNNFDGSFRIVSLGFHHNRYPVIENYFEKYKADAVLQDHVNEALKKGFGLINIHGAFDELKQIRDLSNQR